MRTVTLGNVFRSNRRREARHRSNATFCSKMHYTFFSGAARYSLYTYVAPGKSADQFLRMGSTDLRPNERTGRCVAGIGAE
jgi:hypothetical protein